MEVKLKHNIPQLIKFKVDKYLSNKDKWTEFKLEIKEIKKRKS